MFGPTQRFFKVFALVLLAVFFYAIARAEFLIWNWSLFKSKEATDLALAFLVGLRFDASAAMSLAAPLLLVALVPWPEKWQRIWKNFTWLVFCVIQIPFYIMNLVDTEFINFVGRRFSYDGLFILGEVSGKMMNFLSSYWLLFSINALLCLCFVAAARIVVFQMEWPKATWLSSAKTYAAHGVLALVSISIAIILIRGGLQKKPLSFIHANVFSAPMLNNLSMNSTFTLVKSYGQVEIKREKYFDDRSQFVPFLNGSYFGSMLEGKRPKQPQNVVIIILESFGLEYLGEYKGKSYTPFLDELSKRSIVFNNAFANGRRSIEGVAAVMAGIPALMSEPFISSQFTSNYFLGLGTLLAPANFSSSFFHGGHNGTMFFDSFMKSAGVESYYGATEYNNPADDDGVWGIWDEPFLQWMVNKIGEQKAPFLTSVFTLSSHQPFKVPAQYAEKFPDGELDILKTIAYTDYSLARFFAEAEKKSWYKDTLFIITADHTSKHYRPEYDSEVGNYRVPMIFFHPDYKFPKVDPNMVVQQIDVLPSVLDFLGLPEKDKNFLGSSVFVPGDKVAVNYIDGRYLLVSKDFQLRWSPGQGEPQMYAINDIGGVKPLMEPSDRKEDLEQRLKATIQYFNEGMWDNKLYYPAARK
jgi:Phosphoglycerol transferase and related proteins, alkaline phosphatase superfamily